MRCPKCGRFVNSKVTLFFRNDPLGISNFMITQVIGTCKNHKRGHRKIEIKDWCYEDFFSE